MSQHRWKFRSIKKLSEKVDQAKGIKGVTLLSVETALESSQLKVLKYVQCAVRKLWLKKNEWMNWRLNLKNINKRLVKRKLVVQNGKIGKKLKNYFTAKHLQTIANGICLKVAKKRKIPMLSLFYLKMIPISKQWRKTLKKEL